MDSKELRIGNLLYRGGYICTVKSIEEKGVIVEIINYKEGGIIESHVKPIPLTEEWLVKFGFKESFKGVWKQEDEYFPVIQYSGKATEKTEFYFSSDMHHHTCNGIDYVHELQNTFKAMTKEELKYNG